MLVEPYPVDNPIQYKVTVYGLLPEGKPKEFKYKSASDLAKFVGIENCAQFDLNRKAIRYWIYFKKDNSIDRVDFHMEPPFESKVFDSLDSQVIIKVSDAKNHVETKSDSNEVKPVVPEASRDLTIK